MGAGNTRGEQIGMGPRTGSSRKKSYNPENRALTNVVLCESWEGSSEFDGHSREFESYTYD